MNLGVGRDAVGVPAWAPTWPLIRTKLLELRRRRGLMVAVVLLTAGLPVIFLAIRLIFHLADPASYGPAGSPSVFAALCEPMAQFGFIIAATLGTTAGTTDLNDGVFRHLVVTGRSRIALYLARIPAGLAILLPLVAAGFAVLCLVTCFAGTRQPSAVTLEGISVPAHLSESGLESTLLERPEVAALLAEASGTAGGGSLKAEVAEGMPTIEEVYTTTENTEFNPSMNEMVKIGLWIELEAGIGFMVGLGLGALVGQRTVSTIMIIALEIIVTPILAVETIPYFLNGQRLIVGIALDQLRPAGLASATRTPGHAVFGGRGALSIAPMPTWAMIAVIVAWILGWSVVGAWKMLTRDA